MENPYTLAGSILASSDNMTPASPSGSFTSLSLYGPAAHGSDSRAAGIFHLENESGTGDITLYRVFPGIEMIFNDIHMAYCNKEQKPIPDLMEINYCKEGRSECIFGHDRYCYMSAGDLSFCSLHDSTHQSEFPTSHYHGITVTVDFSAITDEMANVLGLLSIDIEKIKDLSRVKDFTIIRAEPTIEHIFSELYSIPAKIRLGYIRIKVLELLLILTELDPEEVQTRPNHFSAVQIETVKQIHGFLMEHFSEHYTIDELSLRFGLSPTVMKKCFRGVYGDSVYSYMKRYRLQLAQRLLRESRMTISEIASYIGYLNPNKFTSAFCAEFGSPPTSYRKEV